MRGSGVGFHFHCVLEIRIESSWLSTCRKRKQEGFCVCVCECVLGDFLLVIDGGGLGRICAQVADNL